MQPKTKGWIGGIAAAIAAFFIGHGVSTPPAPAPAPAPVTTASASSFQCADPYIDAYSIWQLVGRCPNAFSAPLPSGKHVGRTGPCFQKCLAYDGRNGASGSLSFQNPFHYGDQPYYCGTANKDPFSKATIMWTGSKWASTGTSTVAQGSECTQDSTTKPNCFVCVNGFKQNYPCPANP